MKPYYDQSGITIYLGDCLDVMEELRPMLGVRLFDLLLTDPPYGIKVAERGRVGDGKRTKCTSGCAVLNATDFGVTVWDDTTAPSAVIVARGCAQW